MYYDDEIMMNKLCVINNIKLWSLKLIKFKFHDPFIKYFITSNEVQ